MVEELIAKATAFISANGAWAGPIIGLLAFGESLAVIGLLIPATSVIIAAGGLIGSGLVDPVPVLAWAIAGAILGDWISFLAGRWIGPSAYRRWPLDRHRETVARSRLFFRRYGLAAVFVGRFLGPIRAVIPLVAGVMRMNGRHFQIANVASGLLWVPALLAPGYLAARRLGPAGQITETHILFFAIGIVALSVATTALCSRLLGGGRRRRAPR